MKREEIKVKREEIKELYSIDTENGILIINKRNPDKWLKCQGQYSYMSDMLINPDINILDNGVLKIKGTRLSFKLFGIRSGILTRYPIPLRDLDKNWSETIFYSQEDIIQKNIVNSIGIWPFKNRKKEFNVDHLKEGYYLLTTGYEDIQITSNYRLIGFDNKEIKSLING